MHNLLEAGFNDFGAIVGEHHFRMTTQPQTGHRYLAFRPEDVYLHRQASVADAPNAMAGTIRSLSHQGILTEVTVKAHCLDYRVLLTTVRAIQMELSPGVSVVGTIAPEAVHTL